MSQFMLVTRGIPASGKSTYALKWVAERPQERSRINRDDIRYAAFGKYVLEPALEQAVTAIEHATLRALLKAGRSVVIDNQNLRAKNVKGYLQIAKEFDVPVVHKDFPVELKDALARNATRERQVPEEYLRKVYANFVRKGAFPPFPTLEEGQSEYGAVYVPDSTLPNAWIVDIDGTLARMRVGGRSPYDWHRVIEDEPIEAVVRLVQLLAKDGNRILITSGRDEVAREDTAFWLEAAGVPFDELFMRPAGDSRRDVVIKQEIFDREIRHSYHVRGVLDDRLQVARLWYALGLPLFRVGDPDASF